MTLCNSCDDGHCNSCGGKKEFNQIVCNSCHENELKPEWLEGE